MDKDLLLKAAHTILIESTEEWTQHSVHNGKKLMTQLTLAGGKLAVSEEKKPSIVRSIAFYLGELKRTFDSGELQDDTTRNMDETHFIINMDNKTTLDFRGQSRIKYHDVVSGWEGMTLVLLRRGGERACIEPPMMVFKNAISSYPIGEDTPGITYHFGPSGWMDQRVFCEWLTDTTCVKADPHGLHQVIYMDNVALEQIENPDLQDEMDAVIARKNVELEFLPANSTDSCQPADVAAIQKMFSNKPTKAGEWSGKLTQPGKTYFLQLAVQACRIDSGMQDDTGLSVERKSMIRCGLGKNVMGVWEEKQLTLHLHELTKKHREYFEGKEREAMVRALAVSELKISYIFEYLDL
ncbi:TPA: hypothetical protein N0F65_005324 [Lagenidium giganteum]|uniref:DDE-1 domain-containing protein n=1 Tax=Lagenidium giganteum TaxID=4803 RepID=A0AAV2YU41_9STRA|nr:TPA: hypothetical protein N0F65_005324 [Lagenidium giganteum]